MPHSYLTYSAKLLKGSPNKGKVLRVTFNAEGSDQDFVTLLRDGAVVLDLDQDIFLELNYDKVKNLPSLLLFLASSMSFTLACVPFLLGQTSTIF